MIRVKRNKKYLYVLILFLILGIGFAALAANLKINGTVNIDSSSWDVHFENVEVTQGSVEANPAPTSDNTTTTEMTYTINFTQPGDFYEFTVDIANDGSIDAMVDVISNSTYESDGETPKTLPDYLTSTVTYSDGMEILPNQLLAHNTSEKIKVRVEYITDLDPEDLPSSADTIVFKFKEDYKQANDDAVPVRVDFSTASWDEITTAYANNPASLEQSMKAGTTREVKLDLDNDGTAETTAHLRIANLSTPAECSQEGFSQSACGLVIEFADTLPSHRMNPYVSGDTTTTGVNAKGGWEYRDMRAYLNSTTYTYQNIDYSSTGIYSALPSDLRSKIIDTTVVSGHGSQDNTNFTTTDKLYLLSTKEVWGKEGTSNVITRDSAEAETRQLDYYKAKGVRTDNYLGAIKKNLSGSNSNWWLRSAGSYSNYFIYFVKDSGDSHDHYSHNTLGVSPAFRIG